MPEFKGACTLEDARQLLREAEEHQKQSRDSTRRAQLQVWEALQAVGQATQKENEADLNMGRMVYFLRNQGFPVNLCRGEHHIQVNKGEPFHFLSLIL